MEYIMTNNYLANVIVFARMDYARAAFALLGQDGFLIMR